MRLAAEVCATLALLLSAVVAGVHRLDLLTEDLFDGLFDLKLVGLAVDLEHVLVVQFAEKGRLLAELDRFNDLENVFHRAGRLGSGAFGEDRHGTGGDHDLVKVENLFGTHFGGGDALSSGEITAGEVSFAGEAV